MPLNGQTYTRLWDFVSQYQAGDPAFRAAFDAQFADFAEALNISLGSGLRFLGEWSAASGAFPDERPDQTDTKARDAWVISVGGTVDNVSFATGEILVALVDKAGASYSGNWLRIRFATIAALQAIADQISEDADQVSEDAEQVAEDRQTVKEARDEAVAAAATMVAWRHDFGNNPGATALSLTANEANIGALRISVYIGGVAQRHGDAWTLSGTTITFAEALPDQPVWAEGVSSTTTSLTTFEQLSAAAQGRAIDGAAVISSKGRAGRPWMFASALEGRPEDLAGHTEEDMVDNATIGRSVQIAGGGEHIVAQRGWVRLTPGRVYEARFDGICTTNSSGASTVAYQVKTWAEDGTTSVQTVNVRSAAALAVASGRQSATATLSLDVAGVDFVITAGSKVARAAITAVDGNVDGVWHFSEAWLEDVTERWTATTQAGIAATKAEEAAASAASAEADRIQTGLDRVQVSFDRAQAELAALASGAPLVTTLTTPTPADDTIEMLQTDAGVQVWQVVSGTWAVQGWLGEVLFDDLATLLASTLTGFSAGHVIRLRKEGWSYEVVASGEHLITAGGVKLKALFYGLVNIKALGAAGDGVTDDRAVLATAASAFPGMRIFFPKGAYLIDTDGGSISLSGLTLCGEGQHEYGAPYDNNASVLLISGTTNGAFDIGRGVTIDGLSFFYPDQIETGSAPVAYPALLSGTFVSQFHFLNSTVLNCYRFLEIPVDGIAGDCRIIGNRIFALDRCFQFTGGMPEVMHIANNIFSYGIFEDVVNVGPTYAIRDYYSTSGEWMRVDCGSGTVHASVDGMNIHGNLVFGCRYAIRVTSGRLDVGIIDGNKFDAVPTALGVFTSATVRNIVLSSNMFYSYKVGDPNANESTIYFFSAGDASNLSITGNNFAYSQGSFISIAGTDEADDVLFSGNLFKNWAQTTGTSGTSYYAIAVNDSDMWCNIAANIFTGNPANSNNAVGVEVANIKHALISANQFNNTYYSLKIDDAVSAFVTGNQSSGTVYSQAFIDNGSTAGKVQASGNLWDKTPNLYAYPFSIATISAAQTFTGAKTKANFAAETVDEDGNYDPTTSVFTAPTDGLYSFAAVLTNTNGVTAGDYWSCAIEATGSSTQANGNIQYVATDQVGACTLTAEAQFKLTAGDTVSVYVTRSGGAGNWVQLADATYNYFSCKKVQ